MIVILIILLLSQVGNLSSLFEQREKSQVEQIAVQILSMIDEEKTSALLGKTHQKIEWWNERYAIVRKRNIKIDTNNEEESIELTSKVNLAESPEKGTDIFEPETLAKTWTIPWLQAAWYDCSGQEWQKLENSGIPIESLHINFIHDEIEFETGDTPTNITALNIPRVVLKISGNTSHQEIHIEKRTGLTYTRPGKSDTILCN